MESMVRRLLPLLVLASAVASCSPTEPLTGIDVSTNKIAYEVDEGFNLRVVNLSQSSAWFETSCRGRLRYDLEHRVGWQWELSWPIR